MRKRFPAHYYSKIKTGQLPCDSPYLFSNGIYKTKITESDLPDWYMPGNFYAYKPGYLSAKGVKALLYKPNLIFNHMFKDDMLYISYKDSVNETSPTTEFDEYIWGNNIPRFLIWAEKYSDYDVSSIEQQIENKRLWFMNAFPYDYELEVGKDENILDFYRSLYAEVPA